MQRTPSQLYENLEDKILEIDSLVTTMNCKIHTSCRAPLPNARPPTTIPPARPFHSHSTTIPQPFHKPFHNYSTNHSTTIPPDLQGAKCPANGRLSFVKPSILLLPAVCCLGGVWRCDAFSGLHEFGIGQVIRILVIDKNLKLGNFDMQLVTVFSSKQSWPPGGHTNLHMNGRTRTQLLPPVK